jgi:hypothetical protein
MSAETEQATLSRLSKTNHTDAREALKRRKSESGVRMTERNGVKLRQEARDVIDLEHDSAVSWEHCTNRWRQYIEDKKDVVTVFEDDAGNRAKGSKPHRFHPDYADKQYAKLKDLERGISDEYGKRLHTGMLTFTASSTTDDDEPRPPVDHLDDLLAPWNAVTTALDRAMDGRRYERLAILEPHGSGYLHVHMAVFVDGVVTSGMFEPVIETHVRNCNGAEWDAHDLDDDSTISVRHAGADRDLDDDDQLDDLACYLAEYLGTYGDDPLESAEHMQQSNALLWATGRQRWRPSNGAQEYMKTPEQDEEPTTWEIIGIEKDDELVPCDGNSGGVDTFTTGPVTARIDTPPD